LPLVAGIEPKEVPRKGFEPLEWPDPLLAANIYCRGLLDEVIRHMVVPLSRDLGPQGPDAGEYLWFLRYARGGDHLKVRWHGPEWRRPEVLRLLEEKARLFFSGLEQPASPASPQAQTRSAAPPMDPEDSSTEEHPDRTLLWTTYQRSPIVLGPKPLLTDDRYSALFTRCLGRGAEIVLAAFLEVEAGGAYPHQKRQAVLLSLITHGAAALWKSQEDQASYFNYHRNWLIRIPVLKMWLGESKGREILKRYEATAAKLDGATAEVLKSALRGRPDEKTEGPMAAWAHALASLCDHVQRFAGRPEYAFDPVSEGPLFPTVFKVFHCMANQLGLNTLNEGLAHHLALHALGVEGGGPFSLIPD
jgi:hypothetical protein